MAKTTIPVPRGITFEDVWAGLMENRQQLKELTKEHKETVRVVRETSRQMGGLHRSFGELAEQMVVPGIIRHFNEKGYYLGSVMSSRQHILENGKVKTEVDILMENVDFLIAVEVKSKPKEHDIEHHIKRLEIVREYRNKYHDTRKIHGAIAGAIFTPEVKKLTLDAGLYVIEQSGDTMKIDVPEGFVPREW